MGGIGLRLIISTPIIRFSIQLGLLCTCPGGAMTSPEDIALWDPTLFGGPNAPTPLSRGSGCLWTIGGLRRCRLGLALPMVGPLSLKALLVEVFQQFLNRS